MNKVYIATAIALSAVTVASAAEQGRMMKRPMMASSTVARPPQGDDFRGAPMTTGDATIDAQLKSLTAEMDAKIKAIHDEYDARIKAIVGDKKLIPTMMGSTTPGMMRGDDRARMMGTGTPMMASGTAPMMRGEGEGQNGQDRPQGRPMMQGQGGDQNGQGSQLVPPNFGARVQGFFQGFFGGNK
jgi:hypothetical protein